MFNLNIFEREDLTPIRKLLMMHAIAGGAPLNEYEIEGNPAVFQTNVQKALAGFTIPFFPVQSGSGDPSPDNVRPIIGWTGITAHRTGKNMLAPVLYKGVSYNPSVGTVFNTELHAQQFTDNHDGTFTLTTSSSWQYYCLLFPVRHKKRCYVNIQCSSSGNLGRTVGYLDKDLKVLTVNNLTNTSWTYSVYLKPEETDNAEYWYMVISNRSSASATITVTNPQIEYNSSASEYEPYQGSSYHVTFPAMGKNLLDPGEATSGKGLTLTKNADGSISVEGTPTGTWIDFGWHDVDIPAGTYMLSIRTAIPCTFVLYYYLVGDSTRKYHAMLTGQTSKSVTFDGEVERVCLGLTAMDTSTAYSFDLAVQLESGSYATAYEPYTKIIYGGTLDAVTGVLTVEYVCEDVTENISVNGTLPYGGAQIKWIPTHAKKYASDTSHQNEGLYCNIFNSSESLPSGESYVTGRSTSGNVFFNMPQEVTNLQEASTWFNNNPTQVAYLLAEPVEIQLDPLSVQTLIGDNTIWTDTNGENIIKYKKKG